MSAREWTDVGSSISTLIRLAFGVMDMEPIDHASQETWLYGCVEKISCRCLLWLLLSS